MTLEEAKALLEKMRKAFPLMNHWIEREYDARLVWGINKIEEPQLPSDT